MMRLHSVVLFTRMPLTDVADSGMNMSMPEFGGELLTWSEARTLEGLHATA